jgi:hypothetical protein
MQRRRVPAPATLHGSGGRAVSGSQVQACAAANSKIQPRATGKQMNEILNELAKPVWWFSVVIAGIAINLLSSYLRSRLDSGTARISIWWRSRSAQKKARWDARVLRLVEDPKELALAMHIETRGRMQAIYLLMIGIFPLVFGGSVVDAGMGFARWSTISILGMTSVVFFGSFLRFREASLQSEAIGEAVRRRKIIDGPDPFQ